MTKNDVVNRIAKNTGVGKELVLASVDGFMDAVMDIMEEGKNIYLRGFGTFVIKTRKAKKGRNIKKDIQIDIPAHCVARFKPAKTFAQKVKDSVPPESVVIKKYKK